MVDVQSAGTASFGYVTTDSGLMKSRLHVLRDGRVKRSHEFATVDLTIATADKGFQRRQVRKIYPYFCANLQPRKSLHPETCGRKVGQDHFKRRTSGFAEPRGRGHARSLRGSPLRFVVIAANFAMGHGFDRHFQSAR